MSKGSHRRKENAALVEANWPWPDKGDTKDGLQQVCREAQEDEGMDREPPSP